MKAAQSACQKYMQIGGGETLDPAERAKLQEAALNFARCMRAHGVDMPDPQLSGKGGLTFQAGPRRGPAAEHQRRRQGPRGQPRLAEVQGRRQGVQPLPGRPRGTRREHRGGEVSVAARRGGRGRIARRGGRAVLAAAAVAGGRGRRLARCCAPGDGQAPRPPTTPCRSASPRSSAATSSTARTSTGRSGSPTTTTVAAPAAGTITRLRDEGDTVTRGRSLMSIDAKATAWVLYGTIPMYRDLGPGVSDGSDVRQLERNLKALGYDPGTVDDDWTSATPTRSSRLPGRSRPHPERDDRRARRSWSATARRAWASTARRSATPRGPARR